MSGHFVADLERQQELERKVIDHVKDWAESIAYAARNPTVDVDRTKRSILALTRWALSLADDFRTGARV